MLKPENSNLHPYQSYLDNKMPLEHRKVFETELRTSPKGKESFIKFLKRKLSDIWAKDKDFLPDNGLPPFDSIFHKLIEEYYKGQTSEDTDRALFALVEYDENYRNELKASALEELKRAGYHEMLDLFDDLSAGKLPPRAKQCFKILRIADPEIKMDYQIYVMMVRGLIREGEQDNLEFETAMRHLTPTQLQELIKGIKEKDEETIKDIDAGIAAYIAVTRNDHSKTHVKADRAPQSSIEIDLSERKPNLNEPRRHEDMMLCEPTCCSVDGISPFQQFELSDDESESSYSETEDSRKVVQLKRTARRKRFAWKWVIGIAAAVGIGIILVTPLFLVNNGPSPDHIEMMDNMEDMASAATDAEYTGETLENIEKAENDFSGIDASKEEPSSVASREKMMLLQGGLFDKYCLSLTGKHYNGDIKEPQYYETELSKTQTDNISLENQLLLSYVLYGETGKANKLLERLIRENPDSKYSEYWIDLRKNLLGM